MSPEDYPEEYFYQGLLGTRPGSPWVLPEDPFDPSDWFDFNDIHDYVHDEDAE